MHTQLPTLKHPAVEDVGESSYPSHSIRSSFSLLSPQCRPFHYNFYAAVLLEMEPLYVYANGLKWNISCNISNPAVCQEQ